MPIERELKLGLNETETGRLTQLLGKPVDTALQLNYYLDTPTGALRREAMMLRLRVEKNCCETNTQTIRMAMLTLKGASSHEDELTIRSEEEVEINHEDVDRILADGLALASAPILSLRKVGPRLGIELVFSQGELTNLRRRFALRDNLMLDLDRTEFPDGSVDYEVEVELADSTTTLSAQARSTLRDLFNSAAVPWRPANSGKFKRWLDRQQR